MNCPANFMHSQFIHSLRSCTHYLLQPSLVHMCTSKKLFFAAAHKIKCKKFRNKSKIILIKNHVRKVGEKSTQTGGLDTRHLQPTTLLHLEHYI